MTTEQEWREELLNLFHDCPNITDTIWRKSGTETLYEAIIYLVEKREKQIEKRALSKFSDELMWIKAAHPLDVYKRVDKLREKVVNGELFKIEQSGERR